MKMKNRWWWRTMITSRIMYYRHLKYLHTYIFTRFFTLLSFNQLTTHFNLLRWKQAMVTTKMPFLFMVDPIWWRWYEVSFQHKSLQKNRSTTIKVFYTMPPPVQHCNCSSQNIDKYNFTTSTVLLMSLMINTFCGKWIVFRDGYCPITICTLLICLNKNQFIKEKISSFGTASTMKST